MSVSHEWEPPSEMGASGVLQHPELSNDVGSLVFTRNSGRG